MKQSEKNQILRLDCSKTADIAVIKSSFIFCPRFWLHVPLGIINGLLLVPIPILAALISDPIILIVTFFALCALGWAILITFLIYEMWQCYRIEDHSQKDIIGHLGGLAFVAIGMLIYYTVASLF